ncbi:MAG: type II toxin-antitoxin system HicB family antitoxin [Tildeniella nuda ZEHNDER 1965/U140]|jgi:predicted RNase H-like HicB family nuclease|nr:type II toxin-antitoxin system HicB family antitoxin [Tildeniella nuda ZEHNDER 1965/U140]
MFAEYIKLAMSKATYEILEDNEGFFGSIPSFRGVWANADTLEACRDELAEALEGWILLGIYLHHPIPVLEGIDLNIQALESEVA